MDKVKIMVEESQTHTLGFKHGALKDGGLLAKAT